MHLPRQVSLPEQAGPFIKFELGIKPDLVKIHESMSNISFVLLKLSLSTSVEHLQAAVKSDTTFLIQLFNLIPVVYISNLAVKKLALGSFSFTPPFHRQAKTPRVQAPIPYHIPHPPKLKSETT